MARRSSWFLWSCRVGRFQPRRPARAPARRVAAVPASSSPAVSSGKSSRIPIPLLLIIGLLYYLGVVVISSRRVRTDVPLAERRQASLKPRTIDDFAPRWLSMGSYLLIAVHLTAWVVVGALGLYSTPGFWTRFAGPVCLLRHPPRHRSCERQSPDQRLLRLPRPSPGCALRAWIADLRQIMFALRLYSEVAGPSFETDRAMHLALVLLLTLTMLVLAVLWRHGPRRLNALSLERV